VLQCSGVWWSAGQCKWSRKGEQKKCGASMWDLCDSCGLPLNPVQTARLPTMHASDDQPVMSQDSVRAEVRSGRTSRLSKRQPMHVTVCMSACCPLQLTPNAEAATGNGKSWSFLLSHASTLCVAGETCRSPCAEVRGLMLHSMRRRRRLDRPCAAMHVPLTCHFPGTRILVQTRLTTSIAQIRI
jgi:hypothetical protein